MESSGWFLKSLLEIKCGGKTLALNGILLHGA
jgi:hypothetical protein